MAASSRTHLSVLDGVLLIVGLIIGTSILRVPASIAQQTTGPQQLLGVVVLGALFALCGAYCYAQLSRRYPERGGEYAYLHQALGAPVSFLFIWARTAVLQTGSIAATVYIFGDYATKLVPLGPYSTVLYALLAVLGLSLLNAVGLRLGKAAQNLLTAGKIGGLLLIVAAGMMAHEPAAAPMATAGAGSATPALGLAMVFVLYAYGGWNEASYLAGDVKRGPRDLALVLFISVALVAVAYVVVHLAYLRALGFEGLRASPVPAAEVVSHTFGRGAETAVSMLAALIALGTANATIFTGSRGLQAMGADHPSLSCLGRCDERRRAPVPAFALQGLVAVGVVVLAGVLGRGGQSFEVAVAYTAPAFWGFMGLIGLVAVGQALRPGDGQRAQPALLACALIFVAMDAYMLHSSIAYAGRGALLGLLVVAAGVPVYLAVSWQDARLARAELAVVAEASPIDA